MFRITMAIVVLVPPIAAAEAPVASFIFPAGGQRGTTVKARVGGLNLHKSCAFEVLGSAVSFTKTLKSMPTLWFEGPLLPLPDSQRQEDYPKDMAAELTIAADAELGVRYWQLATAQGATPAMTFQVGDLPEVIEEEIDGEPIPVDVTLPLTINGRLFPRADVDAWRFAGKKGQPITCEIQAARFGSPLDARFEVLDEQGRPLAESESLPGGDARLRFTPLLDGKYVVRIHDIAFQGSQSHVYRLTISDGPYVDAVFPLGGKRGILTLVEVAGQGLPRSMGVKIAGSTGSWAWTQLEQAGKKSNPFLFDVDNLDEVLETAGKPADVRIPVVCNGRIDTAGESDAWSVTLTKGETVEAELRAARLGSRLDGVLTVVDAANKELAKAETPQADGDTVLRFTAPADATYNVRVQDRFRSRGGAAFAYRLRLTKGAAPDFALRLPTSAVTLLRGGKAQVPVTLDRLGGFVEPVTLVVDGVPKGVKATIKDFGKGEAASIQLEADKDAPIQAVRLKVRGTAKRGEQSIERVAVLPAAYGQAGLDSVLLGVGMPTSFKIKGVYDMQWAARGSMLKRAFKIERDGYDGPLEVMLADKQARHLQGVHGPTMTVPAGATEFEYAVHLPPWMETGRTSRTCVMAIAVIKDADGREHEVSFSSVNQNEQMVAIVDPGRLNVTLDRPAVLLAAGKTIDLPVQVARGPGLHGSVTVEVIVPALLKGVGAQAITVAKESLTGTLQLRCGATLPEHINTPLLIRATLVENGRPVIAETRLEVVLKD